MFELQLLLAASTVRAIGSIVFWLVVVGFIVYALFNVRAGRDEVGAEIELAPNKKPYYDDDDLETKKLDRSLTAGLIGLIIIGVSLPVYWLAEPGRQSGAIEEFERIFASRGDREYEAACSQCHGPGGVGGVASYTILDNDNEFVASVNWAAPALDTVLLRYSRDEVTYVLNYGRPFSPMPAWGTPGGGPLTEQQVKNLVDYLASIQVTSEDSKAAVEAALRRDLGLAEGASIDYSDLAVGEALFNLGGTGNAPIAAGAYACARCHTRGWSIDDASAQLGPNTSDIDLYVDYADGAGAFGPDIRNVIPRQFASVDRLADFLYNGAALGQGYGLNGISGDGMMPGFGENPNTEEIADDGMMSRDMVEAIARYVATLHREDASTSGESS